MLTREDEGHIYYALKVLSAECYGTDKDIFEREILRHLRDADKTHVGYKYICHLVDDFEHRGPNGTHVCLVLELMGETLKTFGTLFKKTMVPNSLMRRFTFYLLAGLDYAHDSNIVHTGNYQPKPLAFDLESPLKVLQIKILSQTTSSSRSETTRSSSPDI